MTEAAPIPETATPPRFGAAQFERTAFWMFVGILAWAPFPLGSNRAWAWSLLSILVMLCWLLWLASVWRDPARIAPFARGLKLPFALGGLALLWGVVQMLPIVPQAWTHPVWQLADSVLGTHAKGTISLDPWRTGTEVMKLATYAMGLWLVRVLAARSERANTLMDAFIAIGAVYAGYALVIASLGFEQYNVFYVTPAVNHDVSGPFVNHNSYATYAGLAALCAGARLVEKASVVTSRGWRPFVLSLTQYLTGRGVLYLIAAALTVSTLIATASRAGNAAFLAGAFVLLVFSLILGMRRARAAWVTSAAFAVLGALAVLFAINGNMLASHLDDLAGGGVSSQTRMVLWDAAMRMIENSPLLGLGLGSYQAAYPMYSDVTMRFIMDRVHNDYLELAAGWGLPAAILWWSAICWLAWICARGVLKRRRNRVYPMVAVGASVLVAAHSIFDFSLQMPAIALAYAAVLGLGLAQAHSTRESG